jgi:pimeloyl-ACP methyl ester carboxylesterase
MKSRLLPAIERAGRYALNRRGFLSRVIETERARLHAYDAAGGGKLPTAVVLHGIGSGATAFGATLARIRPHVRRLVALDLPAHGFSSPPSVRLTPEALFDIVKDAIDRVVPEPFILMGNSLGGALALRYAVDRSDQVLGLVLCSPAGARIAEEEWEALKHDFKIESAKQARRLLARLYHRTPWYMPAIAVGFRDVMMRPHIRDLLETATLDDLPTPERLAALTMPVLLVWGRSERILPPSSLAYFRRALPPHAMVEEPAGFGHCPHFDDPKRLAKRVVEFMRGTAGTEPAGFTAGALRYAER